jgi:hypothetical protein
MTLANIFAFSAKPVRIAVRIGNSQGVQARPRSEFPLTASTQDDDRRDASDTSPGSDRGDVSAGSSALGAYDVAWDSAIGGARGGDPALLIAYVAQRGGYRDDAVERLLIGESDENAALLCRAAGLPWESFEGVLTYRARRYKRGPGMFGTAIRMYRDTGVDDARALLRKLTDS